MVRLPQSLLVLAVALSVAGAVPTTTPSPLIFTPTHVSAPVAPGAQSLWFHMQAETWRSDAYIDTVTDTDANGIVELARPAKYNATTSLWTVVDMQTGVLMAGEPSGTVPRQSDFPPRAFLRDASGNFSNLIIDVSEMPSPYDFWELLWVRPGTGAWSLMTADSDSLSDLDRDANNLITLNVSSFEDSFNGAPTPAGFVAGDLLIGIDAAAYYWFGDKVDAHLDEASGPGLLSAHGRRFLNEKVGVTTFRVLRRDGADGTVSIDFANQDGTALNGVHYTAVAGTLTFGPGEIIKVIEVPILDDTTYSGANTTFTLNFSNAAGTTITGPASLLVTIAEDDPKPKLSVVGSATVQEGGAETHEIPLRVELTGATRVAVTTTWSAYPAQAGVTNGGPITFAPGETEKTITFRYAGDALPGADRSYSVSVASSPTSDAVGSAEIKVVDDDYASLSIADATVGENTSYVYVPVTVSAPGRNVSFKYTTADGTATAGSDYTARTETVSINDRSTTISIEIPILRDLLLDEPNETFEIVISEVSGATLADGRAVVTITNAEPPTPSLLLDNWAGHESSDATFLLRLSAATTKEVTVLATTRATGTTAQPGSDFVARTETLRIPAGQTSATFTVDVIDDQVPEGNESFVVDLSQPVNATLSNGWYPWAVGSITDDDTTTPMPAVTIDDAMIVEGHSGTKKLFVRVRLTAAPTTQASVAWATADGTALAGTDYESTTGTLTFGPGTIEQTIAVTILGDAAVEADETFTVNLTSPTGALFARSTATCTITNDDASPPPPMPAVTVSGGGAMEGHSGTASIAVLVSLSSPAQSPVSVTYATVSGTATAGTDYLHAGGTLTFAAGETTRSIVISVLGDTLTEGEESFTVQLTSGAGVTIESGTAVCTIVDDDPTRSKRRSARH